MDIDVICELTLIYVMARGLDTIVNEADRGEALAEPGHLAFNAIGMASGWMVHHLDALWYEVAKQV